MSRILRRPMFRGGPVDSRGTGITSNLGYENGGRVGYQSAGFVTGQQIIDANRNNPFFQTNTLNPRSRFTLGQSRGGLDNLIRATMFDTEQFPLVGKESGLSETASLTDLYKAQTDDDGAEGLLASIDTTFTPKINTKAEASEGEIEIEEKDDDPKTEIIDDSPKEVKTPKPGDDEPEVTMTDLEKALGLDRARQEYAADALAAASKAFFEGKGFGAIADAAAVKSKAPDIKRVAALEEFKADRAEKLYDKKLSAQAKLKLGTRGALQKDLDTLKDLPEGSASRKIGLKKTGFEPTLEEAIKKLQSDDAGLQRPSPSIIIGMMNLYYPTSFKGVISGDTQPKEDGTYILNDASALIIVEDGVSRLQKL